MFVKAILKIKLSEVFHSTTNYCFHETELIPNPFFLESLKSNVNLKALEDAAKENEDTAIRWSTVISDNENLEEINMSFSSPKEFTEISRVCRNLNKFYEKEKSPDSLMDLMQQNDFVRKPDRFLRAERASAYIHEDKAFGSKIWKDIHNLLSDIEVDTSLKEGKLIAKKLHKDRLAALEKFLSDI